MEAFGNKISEKLVDAIINYCLVPHLSDDSKTFESFIENIIENTEKFENSLSKIGNILLYTHSQVRIHKRFFKDTTQLCEQDSIALCEPKM